MSPAEQLLAEGRAADALAALQQQVRSRPADARLRVFLFQLLAVLGQWPRALQQLRACGELDAATQPMVITYTAALQCEALRAAVFAGLRLPHVFGSPTAWVAQLAQALQLDAQGHAQAAAAARAQALESAPARPGLLNGQPFAWIADADNRLGPTLEVIINGRYGWLPIEQVTALQTEPVTDLRDLVWLPAQITFANGGETPALLPVRYDGSTPAVAAAGAGTPAADADPAWLLARATDWRPLAGDLVRGLGQRMLVTDGGDIALLELSSLQLPADAPQP